MNKVCLLDLVQLENDKSVKIHTFFLNENFPKQHCLLRIKIEDESEGLKSRMKIKDENQGCKSRMKIKDENQG